MKALIVDDVAPIRKQVSRILLEFGFSEVLEANCVQEAMALLETDPSVHLIISDLHMPKQTGLDFLRMIRANPTLSHLPFLMLTTEQERNKIIEAARLGLQSYIFKPLQKEVLKARLESLGLLPVLT